MIKTYKDFLKLYEYHPESDAPYTTISNRINKAIEMGAEPYIIKTVLKEILNYYKGQEQVQKFHRMSDEYKYISIISDAIETSLDDGYWEEMIVNDLEKIYNEMK